MWSECRSFRCLRLPQPHKFQIGPTKEHGVSAPRFLFLFDSNRVRLVEAQDLPRLQ